MAFMIVEKPRRRLWPRWRLNWFYKKFYGQPPAGLRAAAGVVSACFLMAAVIPESQQAVINHPYHAGNHAPYPVFTKFVDFNR